MRALLASGSEVGVADKDGKTALHWACQYGHFAILCLLLAHLPSHPLHTQVCTGRCSSISPSHTCTSQGSGVTAPDCGLTAEQCEADTSRGTHCHLSESEHCLHESKVDHDGHVCKLKHQYTVLHSMDTQVPQLCLDLPCVTDQAPTGHMQTNTDNNHHCHHHWGLNAQDIRGQTPLLMACHYGHADLASLLLTFACCEVNCRDKAGNTPLHRAIRNSQDALACLLCAAGADLHAVGRHRLTPLHEAVRAGRHRVIHALVSRGCDVNARSSSMAAPTPFLTAIFHYKMSQRSLNDQKCVDTTLNLLIRAGCRLSEGDGYWTPLSAAIDIGSSHIASLLLYHGCHLQSRQGRQRGYGHSVLVEAFTRCDASVVKLLLTCGYRISCEEVEQCSRRIPAFSPLFYRISHSQRTLVKTKLQLLHWLRQRASNPPSLLELCRTRLRQTLNHAACDTSIVSYIPNLPLPQPVKDYVSLSHLELCPYT